MRPYDEEVVYCEVCGLPALELKLCALHFDDYQWYKKVQGMSFSEYLAFAED